jgi:hypothetical protein
MQYRQILISKSPLIEDVTIKNQPLLFNDKNLIAVPFKGRLKDSTHILALAKYNNLIQFG